MIYSMNGKYYINISPSIYKEIKLRLDGEDLILVPSKEKVEINDSSKLEIIYLNNPLEKGNLIKKLFNTPDKNSDEEIENIRIPKRTSTRKSKYSKRS